MIAPATAEAQVSLPPGFTETFVAPLTDPTAMQFAPDGRLFVCEQRGTLRVIKDGALLPTPFVSLTVSSIGERGLLGVAFDPAFASNQYVYVYYTATTPTLRNRVSRFTASGDVAVPGSEVVIFDLPEITTVATNHNGGAINFGADGKLYIAVGDSNVPAFAQSLTTTRGKMLRINPDGAIPADNPFFGVTTGSNRAIWALGLRNPFTFAFNSDGTRMFINDVGENTWEEINEGIAGANYGWPQSEGATSDPGITSPLHAYSHSTGCAITGGAFYPAAASQFPQAYAGVYFFTDICGFFIRMVNPAAGNAVTTFATGIIYPLALAVSPFGDLYYLERNQGGVHRISYGGGRVTADSVTPASGSGAAQTFALRYSNSYGAGGITRAFALISGSASSCVVYYDRALGTLGLLNDAGTRYLTGTAGASGTLANTHCMVSLAGSSAAASGTTLTVNVAMSFTSAFAGATVIYLYAENTAGGESGWHSRGTWTVAGTPPPAVTADSVSPSSGSGSSQTFALRASDTSGAANIRTMFVWFTPSASASVTNSCLVFYDVAMNTVGLLNDGATQYLTGAAGASGSIGNGQCAIALGAVTRSASGNTLTINIALTFTPAFAGAKSVILYAANAAGATSGWQTVHGTWTVPAGAPAPAVGADSITPSSGSGAAQTFALRFSDSAGASGLETMYVLFSSAGGSSCLGRYERASNTVAVLNDAGNQYVWGMVGGAGSVSNSRCAISLAGSSAAMSGTSLTLNLATTFMPVFAGAMNIYLYAANASGINSGWQQRGTWTAAGSAPAPAVSADSVTPSSGSGVSQVFAMQLSDKTGAANLATVFALFSGAANSCLVHFDRASNRFGLLNDAGTQYVTGSAGTAGTLTNSFCTVTLAASSAMLNGNTLTLNVAMSFTGAFSGAKDIYLYAANAAGLASGWQARATWTVP